MRFLIKSIILCNAISETRLLPLVVLTVIFDNRHDILPYFLMNLQNLSYPKQNLALYLAASVGSTGKLESMLKKWTNQTGSEYHEVTLHLDGIHNIEIKNPNESFPKFHRPKVEMAFIMEQNQKALEYAVSVKANYIAYLSSRDILLCRKTIEMLQATKVSIIAPAMLSIDSQSNFWPIISPDSDTVNIKNSIRCFLKRTKIGIKDVTSIVRPFLINLRHPNSSMLNFLSLTPLTQDYYPLYYDDTTFVTSALSLNIPLGATNHELFGYQLNFEISEFEQIEEIATYIALELLKDSPKLSINIPLLPLKPKNKLAVDAIYILNLEIQKERLESLKECFRLLDLAETLRERPDEIVSKTSYILTVYFQNYLSDYILSDIKNDLGLTYSQLIAVSGSGEINADYVKEHNIIFLSQYIQDTTSELTKGQIGCAMSHLLVWQDIWDRNLKSALVLEDDIAFGPGFIRRFNLLMLEAQTLSPNWDLIYLDRVSFDEDLDEQIQLITGAKILGTGTYSFSAIAYIVSLHGAKKLIDGDLKSALLPVDNYISIMADLHPNKMWSSFYQNRNLMVFNSKPNLVYPRYFMGEEDFHSDTTHS